MANSETPIDRSGDESPKDESAVATVESTEEASAQASAYVPPQSGGFVPTGAAAAEEPADDDEDGSELDEFDDLDAEASRVGAGVAETMSILSLVAAVIGVVGSWFGNQFALASQLRTEIAGGQAQTAAAELAPYTKSIHDTALVHGVFALVGVLLAALAVAWLPPGRSVWARIVAQASAVVGVAGLVLAILVMTNVVAHVHV